MPMRTQDTYPDGASVEEGRHRHLQVRPHSFQNASPLPMKLDQGAAAQVTADSAYEMEL